MKVEYIGYHHFLNEHICSWCNYCHVKRLLQASLLSCEKLRAARDSITVRDHILQQ